MTKTELRARRADDFARVEATDAETSAYQRRQGFAARPPRRLECRSCGKRIWHSGLGIAAHRRACAVQVDRATA